jgi:hypothetical protein
MKKIAIFITITAWFAMTATNGQQQTNSAINMVWKKNYDNSRDGKFHAITTVYDGIVTAGSTSGKEVYRSGLLVKYDYAGNVVWERIFGGSRHDYFLAVTALSDGFVAAGYSQKASFGARDWAGVTAKGEEDAIIVKYDHKGNLLWKKNFGGRGVDKFNGVLAVSDGVIAVGESSAVSIGNGDWAGTTGNGASKAILVKYDHDGRIVWKKHFGGIRNEWFNAITATPDGFVVAGCSYSRGFDVNWENGGTATGGKAGNNSSEKTPRDLTTAIIVKFDLTGNVVWKKQFGGLENNVFSAITASPEGIIAVGSSSFGSFFSRGDWEGISATSKDNAIIVHYDHAGNRVWKHHLDVNTFPTPTNSVMYEQTQKHFPNLPNRNAYFTELRFNGVAALPDGFIAVGDTDKYSCGNYTCDAILVKYDHAGNVVWKKHFGGGYDWFYAVSAVSKGFAAVGHTTWQSVGKGDWKDVARDKSNNAIIVYFE